MKVSECLKIEVKVVFIGAFAMTHVVLLFWNLTKFCSESEQSFLSGCYSLMNFLFNQTKTWHPIVCWFLCFYPFLPVFSRKLFWRWFNFFLDQSRFHLAVQLDFSLKSFFYFFFRSISLHVKNFTVVLASIWQATKNSSMKNT